MMMTILSGKYKIINSGSVILYDDDSPIRFTVEIGVGFAINIEMVFATQEDMGTVIKKDVDLNNNLIKYTCYNFENSLGTGTTKALDLATYNNKNAAMHFWSYFLGEKGKPHTRRIDYTFFIEQ